MVYSLSVNKRASQHNHKSKTIHYMLGLPFIFCSALHTHSPLPSPSQEEGKIKFAHTTTNIINCSFSFQFYLEHFRKFIFICYTLGMMRITQDCCSSHIQYRSISLLKKVVLGPKIAFGNLYQILFSINERELLMYCGASCKLDEKS